MNTTKNPYGWFEEKHYGWGWVPAKWQGWVVLLGYLGLIYFGVTQMGTELDTEWFIVPTILLIAICYKTGGRPRWRWGDRIWK